ncbi:MAG: TetR/AcrR family transcriptional regulator, partial [Actinomycetota bacterium]
MQGDKAALTRSILDAALVELADVGQADFAVERVAKNAYCSVGSVYERWRDRGELLADLARGPIMVDITTRLDEAGGAREAISWVLDGGRPQLLLAGEILLAGHTNATVREPALALWNAIASGLRRNLPEDMTWYVATYAVGSALLGALNIDTATHVSERVRWLLDACDDATSTQVHSGRATSTAVVDIPVVPPPSRTDDVSRSLVAAAQELLSDRGAGAATTRDIAAGAGVTTGALYRRYEGKSRLLSDVLVTQLEPDRYEWTWSLVQALASADPLAGSAAVLANRMIEVAQDLPAQQVLLQVGVAARNDPGLRELVADRIRVAHEARTDMVGHFVEAGILRDDIPSDVLAWGLQVIPVGVRATLPLGVPLDG